MRRSARAIVLAIVCTFSLTTEADKPLAREKSATGHIAGTVVWAGSPPTFQNEGCNLHAWDVEGHPEVSGGLAGVVVVAEPIDASTKRWFRERTSERDVPGQLAWGDDVSRIALALPSAAVMVDNQRRKSITLEVYRENSLVGKMTIGPAAQGVAPRLTEGLYRVRERNSEAEGWIFVTPFPAKISGGNCRFMFGGLPSGEYQVSGWHLRAGRVERQVRACTEVGCKIVLLAYGRFRR